MKTFKMFIYYLIPIAINFLFLPFCFFDKFGTVSLIEILAETFITPIYLIIISIKFFGDFNIYKFFFKLFIMLWVNILVIIIGYFNWGVTTGYLYNPDSETVLIVKLQIIISSIIILVGWCIAVLIKIKYDCSKPFRE